MDVTHTEAYDQGALLTAALWVLVQPRDVPVWSLLGLQAVSQGRVPARLSLQSSAQLQTEPEAS